MSKLMSWDIGRGRVRRLPAIQAYLGALTLLLVSLLAAGAQASTPTHRFLFAMSGSSTPAGDFNHACGAAVDSHGHIYVASSGHKAFDIFDAERKYLATIANSNGACGLAVDSNGDIVLAGGTSAGKLGAASGQYAWRLSIDGMFIRDVALAPSGAVLVTGEYSNGPIARYVQRCSNRPDGQSTVEPA